MAPNNGLKFAEPIIILKSFKILTKGKWYIPASGLLTLSKEIKIVPIAEITKEWKIIFFSNSISFFYIF